MIVFKIWKSFSLKWKLISLNLESFPLHTLLLWCTVVQELWVLGSGTATVIYQAGWKSRIDQSPRPPTSRTSPIQ